jgi:hypothetical protein
MDKIEFEDGIFLYHTKLISEDLQKKVLNDTQSFLKIAPYAQKDNYGYFSNLSVFNFENDLVVNNGIDNIIKASVSKCIDLINQNNEIFNKINVDAWINVVRAKNPRQTNFKKNGDVKLHNHVDIQNKVESFYPTYTFVYYAQMPDNLFEKDGTLIIGGKNDRYYYLPQVGDLIIMGGDIPHSPNLALNSTKDRIVIAGNVGFEYVKQKHSLI